MRTSSDLPSNECGSWFYLCNQSSTYSVAELVLDPVILPPRFRLKIFLGQEFCHRRSMIRILDLNAFIRFRTLLISVKYSSWIHNRIPDTPDMNLCQCRSCADQKIRICYSTGAGSSNGLESWFPSNMLMMQDICE